MTAELILYACPKGELADQIHRYFIDAKQQFSWNPAHDYMPHCSLTGFFHDTQDSIPLYVSAIENALAEKRSALTEPAIAVIDLLFRKDFHGLTLSSDWISGFMACFAAGAPTNSRIDRLRLKYWLHLSLAYRFPESEYDNLWLVIPDPDTGSAVSSRIRYGDPLELLRGFKRGKRVRDVEPAPDGSTAPKRTRQKRA
jgi:ubiquitin-associated SH3 domain-containing protein